MDIPVTGISIGRIVYDTLANDTAIATLGVRSVMPCFNRNAEKGYPFILFNTGNALNIPVKSSGGMDEVTFTVESCAKTYTQCVSISEAVRSAIEGGRRLKSLKMDDGRKLSANQFTLRDVDEFYDLELDCYVQKLQFSCKAWGEWQEDTNMKDEMI